MEQHLNDKSGIEKEWESLVNYVTDDFSSDVAKLSKNVSKSRYSDILPCKYFMHFYFVFKDHDLICV